MQYFFISKKIVILYAFMVMILMYSSGIIGQTNTNKNSSYSINSSSRNGKSIIRIKNNGSQFNIEYEGEFTLSDDDKDIIAITNGGFFEIKKSSFGNRRRVLIESEGNGKLNKRYYVGGSQKPYIPDGGNWLAEILPEVVRSTTIGAKSRVARFYKKGGVKGVMTEINQINSDFIKSKYFELILDYKLSTNELVTVIEQAGNQIKSDHYLAEILNSNQTAFLANNQTINAYIEASGNLKSDHYLTQVLKQVINDKSITDSQLESLLKISQNIKSDHYLTQVLLEIMDNRTLNSKNIEKIINLSRDISSDHYKTEVLKKVVNEKDIPTSSYDSLIATINDINSDFYTTEVVKELLKNKVGSNNKALDGILDIVSHNISSDHYATVIYKQISKLDLSESQLIKALNSTKNLSSDHYLSEVLMAFSSKVKRSSESVKLVYRDALKSIHSDTYYGKAAKAID